MALVPLRKGAQAVLKPGVRTITEITLELGGIGIGGDHIAGLHGNKLSMGLKVIVSGENALFHQHTLQRTHELEQLNRRSESTKLPPLPPLRKKLRNQSECVTNGARSQSNNALLGTGFLNEPYSDLLCGNTRPYFVFAC